MLDPAQLDSDLLTEYALGLLSEDQAAEVETALVQNPQAREELSRYLGSLSQMVEDLGPAEVPTGAGDRLLARLNAETQQAPTRPDADGPGADSMAATAPAPPVQPPARRPRPWLYPLLAVAAVAAVLLVAVPVLNTRVPSFQSYAAQPGAVAQSITDKSGTLLARVVRVPDGHAYVQMQATLPAGRVYQAWKVEGGKPVSLGLFEGRSFIEAIPAGTVFAVSVEPTGGSPQPTTTPLFAQAI